jgi:SAM-dependent methyltransferase
MKTSPSSATRNCAVCSACELEGVRKSVCRKPRPAARPLRSTTREIVSQRDMKPDSPKEYWRGVAADFGSADAIGFAPVLHPTAPFWFNEQIDQLQFRAVLRALGVAQIVSGAKVLDVGCGTGRWVRRFQALGLKPTGLDATPEMLRLASRRLSNASLLSAEAHRLPLADQSFDCVTDITVVQHISPELQPMAIAEMLRVLRPGGSLVLMELIRGHDSHIFPRKPEDWIRQATNQGARLIDWFGQEYLILDRTFVRLALALLGLTRGADAGAALTTPGSTVRSPSLARHIFWGIRRVTVPVSVRAEPIAAKFCSSGFATHGVFVFRK